MTHAHAWRRILHPITGEPYLICPCGAEQVITPTPPPPTDAACWPFACRDYHDTDTHRTGEDPCACPCHEETR